MSLSLGAVLDRPLVARRTPDVRYCMLTIQAIGSDAPRLPLNLGLAIDTSGSMHGTKLARVKEAAGLVVRHLTAVDRISIVTYDDDARVIAPSTPLTTQGRTDLLYRIGRIEAGGWTNLGSGWATACHEVAQQDAAASEQNQKGATRVLLLSDGLANVGTTSTEELVEHTRQLNARGIVTSTMGVGNDFNGDLLEPMARQGGGRFQYVESAQQLPDCVQGELGELLQIVARGVAVEVSLPAGLQHRDCLNDFPMERTKQGVRIRLGDLANGDVRHILLELEVDAEAIANEPLALQALAVFTDVQIGRGTELAFPDVQLRPATTSEAAEQIPDPDVEREVELLRAAQARKEAVRLSVLGDHRAAHDVLAEVCQNLLASPYASHPTVVSQINSLSRHVAQASLGLSHAQRHELGYQAYLIRETRPRYDRPPGTVSSGGFL